MRLSAAAEKAITQFSWPGNVREIQNRIQRATLIAEGTVIDVDDLDIRLGTSSAESAESLSLAKAREELDRRYIAMALEKSPGNLTHAAKILDIDRKSLRILCEKYGIPF
jgi:two-component system NtrC family response regulator